MNAMSGILDDKNLMAVKFIFEITYENRVEGLQGQIERNDFKIV
jgi:hypothetical protein